MLRSYFKIVHAAGRPSGPNRENPVNLLAAAHASYNSSCALDTLSMPGGAWNESKMSGKLDDGNDEVVISIASMRLAVGLLGERDNAAWWNSGFLSPTSTAFISPVFGNNALQARYQGVLEAAKRVHDERIGVGHAFHLFRLSENLEQRLFEAVLSNSQYLTKIVSSTASAKAILDDCANKTVAAKSGPALLAASETFGSAKCLSEAASLYAAAFDAGLQCFPYTAGAR